MAGDILMGILGVVFLIGAVMQFRCTGPVWSTEYFAASPKEKRALQTKEEYFWSAIGCLLIGILFLLSLVYTLTELKAFLYIIWGFSAFLFLHIIYGIYRAVHKSTLRR